MEVGCRMDIISLILGFVIGVIFVALAVEMGLKKTTNNNPSSKHAKNWSIGEISNPRIMAEYISDIKLPKNSKILVNKYKDKKMFAGMDVKEHSGLRGNFIVGDDRALILSGPVKQGEVAFWTVEEEIVRKLNQEFNEMWAQADRIESEEEKK
jgi:hypothetical protein